MYNLLLIDDDIEFIKLVQVYSKKSHKKLNITFLNDPRKIFSEFSLSELQTFDAIVADFLMPHINGEQLLKQLRRNAVMTPFILCSSVGNSIAIEDHIEYFLRKRKSIDGLLRELTNYLEIRFSDSFNFVLVDKN